MKAVWLGILVRGIFLAGILCGAAPVAAEPPRVVVTIKPIHSLVSLIMAGIATPELLVKGQASPHTYALRPSETRALNHADVFFRVGEAVEPFTAKIAAGLPGTVAVITLMDTPSLTLLKRRAGAAFEPHDHADPHDARAPGSPSHADPEGADGHIWLDPENARLLAGRIAKTLAKRFPLHAAALGANGAALDAKLVALDAELRDATAPLKSKPFAVYHDAFQYFEERYGLQAVGSILIGPDVSPSGRRLSTLRQRLAQLDAACIFAEPQADQRLVEAIVEGTAVRTGIIDPDGLALEPGPDLYFQLLRDIASGLRGCLAPRS